MHDEAVPSKEEKEKKSGKKGNQRFVGTCLYM